MRMRWQEGTQCYEFDSGLLFGGIEPYSYYHGICGLMHRSDKRNIVRPKKAFLNAEYYLRPGFGVEVTSLPRELSNSKQTSHQRRGDGVVIHFPSEPEFEFSMDLEYRPHADVVDMHMTITPAQDVPQFEIFFASYVCEAFDETWTPLKNPGGGEEWVKLDNRNVVNEMFLVFRDESRVTLLEDGPSGEGVVDQRMFKREDRTFSKPILLARNSLNGLALIFLCDPRVTKYLAGQYHGWDTAHDFGFGADLAKGQKMEALARMVLRPFKDIEDTFEGVSELWSSFEQEVGSG